MLLLCLDTATAAVTVALVELTGAATPPGCGWRVIAERSVVDPRRHGELLMPLVREVVAEAGVSLTGVTAVAAGTGPGPYTSLRVGVVSAAVLAEGLGVAAYGAVSLDLLAVAAGRACVAVTDARRREVYWARYADTGARLEGPAVATPAELAAGLHPGESVVGPGAVLYREVLGVSPAPPELPAARFLAPLVAERVRAGAPSEVLTPRYLRLPDARVPAGRAGPGAGG